jgi:hypothetical protein
VAIVLGTVTFDETHTAVKEVYEEVGGRDERKIEVSGLVVGESSPTAIEARLDAILAAASTEDYGAVLSVRAGRFLQVRRDALKRELSEDALVGSFHLVLAAKDPFEVSVNETSENWTIAASGATRQVSTSGNASARPVIAVLASGELLDPALDDGERRIAYSGTVASGSVIEFDGAGDVVRLDGADVTPYTQGDFPKIAPEGTTLTYTDDPASSHTASAVVTYRDRWW